MARLGASWVVGVALSGCAAVEDAPLVQGPDAEPVIGVLQLADRTVSILSAADGVRYGLHDREGRWLATLTLEELESRDPELYEIAKAATAARGPAFDARLDLPRPMASSSALPAR